MNVLLPLPIVVFRQLLAEKSMTQVIIMPSQTKTIQLNVWLKRITGETKTNEKSSDYVVFVKYCRHYLCVFQLYAASCFFVFLIYANLISILKHFINARVHNFV